MICRKCKTAIIDNKKMCPVCGRALRGSSRKWKVLAAVFTGAAIVSIFVLRGDGEPLTYEEQGAYYEAQGEVPPEIAAGTEVVVSDDASEISLPVSQANLDKPILEVWAMIDEVSRLISEYHDRFSQSVTFLSKNGYLFDAPAGNYVFIEELYSVFNIDERFLDESIMFFYFRPIDLYGRRNLSVSERDELVIFTGFETREGFAVTGRGEQGGMITREELREILDLYSWNHGEVREVDSQSDVFELSMRAIAGYTGHSTGFDIRYMYQDDRYICLVASPGNAPLNISMFILEYVEGAVYVRLGNIEELENHIAAVNNALPNFNHALLPPYNLRLELRDLRYDFADIIEQMIGNAYFTDDDLPPRFMSGTDEFIYFEFDQGRAFLAHIKGGDNKTAYFVESHSAARELLTSLSRRPPLFIIRQS